MVTMTLIKVVLSTLLLNLLFFPFPSTSLFSFPPSWRSSQPATKFRWKRASIFTDSPNALSQMRFGLQGITTGLGRSMKSLMDAGSILGQRMLGLSVGLVNKPASLNYGYARPRPPLIQGIQDHPDVYQVQQYQHLDHPEAYDVQQYHHLDIPEVYQVQQYHHPEPDCDCQFGLNDEVNKFKPVKDTYNHITNQLQSSVPAFEQSYGSPTGSIQESYGSPSGSSFGSSIVSVQESYGLPAGSIEDSYQAPPSQQDAYGIPQSPVQPIYEPETPQFSVQPIYESPNLAFNSLDHPILTHNSVSVGPQSNGSPLSFADDPDFYGPPLSISDPESYGSPLSAVLDQSVASRPSAPTGNQIIFPPVEPIPPIHGPPITLHQVLETPTTSNLAHALVLGAQSVVQEASAPVPDQINPEKYEQHDPEKVRQSLRNTLYYKDLGPLKFNLIHKRGSGKVRHHLSPVVFY